METLTAQQIQQMQQEAQLQEQQEEQIQQEAQIQEQQEQHEDLEARIRREEAVFWTQNEAPAGAVQDGAVPREEGMSKKESRTLQKRRERALRKGGKYTRYPDIHTVQLHQGFVDHKTNYAGRGLALGKAMKKHPDGPRINIVAKQIATAYMPDFKCNKKGRPASKQDAEIARQAQQQAEDYLYGTPAAKKAVFDNIVQQMLTLELRSEMFTVPYMRAHYRETKRMNEKLMMMRQVRGLDTKLFATLSPQAQELWDVMNEMSGVFNLWTENTSLMSGLDSTGGGTGDQPSTVTEYAERWLLSETALNTLFPIYDNAVIAYKNSLNNH